MEVRNIVQRGMNGSLFLKFPGEASGSGCGADYTEGRFLPTCFPQISARLVLRSRFGVKKAIRDARDLHHLGNVVNAHNVRPI